MDFENPGQVTLSHLAGSRPVQGAILAILFSLLPLQDAAAHDPGLSSLIIRPRTSGLETTLTLAAKDAAQLAELDQNRDGTVTQVEFGRSRWQLEAAVAREVVIAADGKVVKDKSISSRLDEKNNVEVRLDFGVTVFSSLEIQSKLIGSLPLGHREYLQVQNSDGKTVFERLLSASADGATVQMSHIGASNAAFETVGSFEFPFSGCETYFDRLRSLALSLGPVARGTGLSPRTRYHHFIYNRALDHPGCGDTARCANSKPNCGAIDRCFHRLCRS